MRFFRSLIEQSLERTREATLGVLGINHSGLRRHLSESMVNTLGDEGCFLAPPVFEHTFGWQEAELRLRDLQPEGLLSPSLLDTLANAPAYRFPKTARRTTAPISRPPPMRTPACCSGTGPGIVPEAEPAIAPPRAPDPKARRDSRASAPSAGRPAGSAPVVSTAIGASSGNGLYS